MKGTVVVIRKIELIRTGTDKPILVDLSNATSSGGQTNSLKVEVPELNGTIQYKGPIAQNALWRQVKAKSSDSENLGEYLAATLAKIFEPEPNQVRVPTVNLVVDTGNPHLSIASEYLKGESKDAAVKPLNLYMEKPSTTKEKHVSLTKDKHDSQSGIYNINRSEYAVLKKELARALAVSILVGDHDVNPGNMIVVQDPGKKLRVGRIDYGHAFNDLKRFEDWGGVQIHRNEVIDFLNRTSVDSIKEGRSKLWRSYSGLVPSRELADALKEVANKPNAEAEIRNAVQQAKNEVLDTLNKNPHLDRKQIIGSFQRIAEHLDPSFSSKKLNEDQKVNLIFRIIENQTVNNLKQMKYAAQIMDLQIRIQQAVEKGMGRSRYIMLQEEYNMLSLQGRDNNLGPFSWIREDENTPPCKPSFSTYVLEQKYKSLNSKIDKFLSGDPPPPEHEKAIVNELKVIVNSEATYKEKKTLLHDKLNQFDSNPTPKSSLLRKLFDVVRSLWSSPQQEPVTSQEFNQFKDRLKEALAHRRAPAEAPKIEEVDHFNKPS